MNHRMRCQTHTIGTVVSSPSRRAPTVVPPKRIRPDRIEMRAHCKYLGEKKSTKISVPTPSARWSPWMVVAGFITLTRFRKDTKKAGDPRSEAKPVDSYVRARTYLSWLPRVTQAQIDAVKDSELIDAINQIFDRIEKLPGASRRIELMKTYASSRAEMIVAEGTSRTKNALRVATGQYVSQILEQLAREVEQASILQSVLNELLNPAQMQVVPSAGLAKHGPIIPGKRIPTFTVQVIANENADVALHEERKPEDEAKSDHDIQVVLPNILQDTTDEQTTSRVRANSMHTVRRKRPRESELKNENDSTRRECRRRAEDDSETLPLINEVRIDLSDPVEGLHDPKEELRNQDPNNFNAIVDAFDCEGVLDMLR